MPSYERQLHSECPTIFYAQQLPTHLIGNILADILEFPRSQSLYEVADLGPLFSRLFREIDAVHGPCARFGQRQCSLESDSTICSRHERDAVG